jgi:hypothetical protein
LGGASSGTSFIIPVYTSQIFTVAAGNPSNSCITHSIVAITASPCLELPIERLGETLIVPNPNTGEFTFESDKDISVTLVNVLGQRVREITVSKSNNYRVSVSGLSRGVYFIYDTAEKHVVRTKIVVY